MQLGTYAIAASVALSASPPQTPTESTSPIVTFAHRDTSRIAERLTAAKVNIRVAPTWLRISPSIYNDMTDIERLLEALG